MRFGSLQRSTPFRLAVTFAAVFVLSFILTGLLTYQLLKAEFVQELDDTIIEIHRVLASTYAGNDLEDLVSTVDSYARVNAAGERIFSLVDGSGKILTGSFAGEGLPDGFSTVSAQSVGAAGDVAYRILSGPIGNMRLIVGESFEQTQRLESITILSFAWASVLVIGIAVGCGILLASRIQRRLDGIADAMSAVSHGALDTRVPLHGNGDDIDTVSSQINEALARLALLMESMRQISSDIAHELKTPLNRLRLQIDRAIAGAESGDTPLPELLAALEEADQINATFEALLRISQIEAGARKDRFRATDLSSLTATVAEIYRDVAEDSRMTLKVSSGMPRSILVHGDKELLTQMLVNLVENAIRHCPQGTSIGLDAWCKSGTVFLVVDDDGPGIPEHERGRVTQRLYRLDKSRTTPGSGLGLSLVKAIVELHGGTIAIGSNDPGTRVEVALKVYLPEEGEA